MEYYDQTTDKWTLLDSTSVGREGAGLVSLGDSLYCIGKFKLHINISIFIILIKFIWKICLFIIYYCKGGYDGFNLLRSVERYDLHTSTWSMIANMLTPRSDAGCAALNYRIFVCGGFDGHGIAI